MTEKIKLIFKDKDGKEKPLQQKNVNSFFNPPETIEDAINLASVAYIPGMYSPGGEATKKEIKGWLYASKKLSREAAEYAAEEGYKEYKKKYKKCTDRFD